MATIERRVSELEDQMNHQSLELAAIRETVEGHSRRFDSIDQRFTGVDRRFEAIDRRFDAVDRRFDAVDRRFDAVDRRFDALDTKMSRQFMWMVGLLVTVLLTIVIRGGQ